MYLAFFRLGVVKDICSLKFCPYLTSAAIVAFRSRWNGSQDPRMTRLTFSVVESRFWRYRFVMNWDAENNYACPPICLILRVLLHRRNCKASGSLIVPLWHSAPFWPMICPDGRRFPVLLLTGWNVPHSKKPTFPVVVIACLETKIWSSGWLLWESTSIVRYLYFFLNVR